MEMGKARSLTVRPRKATPPCPPPSPRPAAWRNSEVARAARRVEADEVRPEQPLHDLLAPGQLDVQLHGREGDVQEEPDPQVRTPLAEHARHQLELVVLHPDRRALGGDLVDGRGEPLVDPHVGLPPVPVVRRRGDDIVVERPQRVVGEALVVVLDVLGRQGHRVQLEAVVLERLGVGVGQPRPADPGALVAAQHRLQRGDQPPGLCFQFSEPSGARSRSTGSRLATTTNSAAFRSRPSPAL